MADSLGSRMLFGVIVPSTNTAVQPEYDDMRPNGVTNHISRAIIPDNPVVDEDTFLQMVKDIHNGTDEAIRAVMTCSPDHLILGMSLETFWDGAEEAKKLHQHLEEVAGVGVTMASTACQAALEILDGHDKIKKIACITPYLPIGDKNVHRFFEDIGYDVKVVNGLKCRGPRLIAHEQPEALRQACLKVDSDDVDAIIQCGTNLAFAHVAPTVEKELGKPVIAINIATYWHALRNTGIQDKIDGFGPLLAIH